MTVGSRQGFLLERVLDLHVDLLDLWLGGVAVIDGAAGRQYGNRLLRRFIQTQAAAASARSRQPPTAPPVAGPASCAAVPSSVALGKAGPGGGDGKGGGGDGAGSTNDTSVLVTCTALALVMVIALTEAGPALRLGKRSSIPALLSTFAATFLTVTLGVVPLLLCGRPAPPHPVQAEPPA